MREIVIKPGDAVPLGFRGENDATQILFDVTGWAEEFGEGVFQLLARLPGDEDAYTVPITTSGGYVRWTVTSGDTAIAGSGAAQLEYYVGTALAKSCRHLTVVAESLGPSSGIISDAEAWAIGERDGEPVPETDETYHNNAKYYAGEAEASSEAAAASAEAAQETVEGAQAAIDAAKAAAVQDVQAEGTTQIQAVQAAGSQAAQAATGAAAEALRWAQQSATNAQQARANAEITNTMLGLARQAAADAEVSASDAEGSATDAAGSATQAAGSATAAAESAAAAQTAAERDVPAAAAAWLSEHVDPATGYVIDDSLTIQGAAGDAKATGDAISSINGTLDGALSSIPESLKNALLRTTGDEGFVFIPGQFVYKNVTIDGQTVHKVSYQRNDKFVCTLIPCDGDTTFKCHVTGGSGVTRAYFYCDENMIAIQTGSANLEMGGAYTAPARTKFVALTNSLSRMETGYFAVRHKNANYDFTGKTVAIIGDSISTNGNWAADNPLGNVPEIVIASADVGTELSAYATYYDIGTTIGGREITAADVGTEVTFTPTAADVGKMIGKPANYNGASIKTWWEVAQDKLGFNAIPVCWSGASVTSHEGDKDSYKTSYAWHPAQIRKCGIRTPGTMERTAPDVIIIYRGTNDFSHSPYAKLTSGYFNGYLQGYPATDYVEPSGGEAYYGFCEGIMKTVGELRKAYPQALIILCTLNVFKRVVYNSFPTRNGLTAEGAGQATLPMYNNAIRAAANYLGCPVIEFDKDGITFENCYSGGYITDNATTPTHPSEKGHKVMGKRALIDLAAINGMV